MIEIREAATKVIEDHARGAFPEECCGFLRGHIGERTRVIEAHRAKNVAVEDRARRYMVDPLELLLPGGEPVLVGLCPRSQRDPSVPVDSRVAYRLDEQEQRR